MTSTENPTASVLEPLTMVSYQADSIVSRQIVNKDTGTVTLFAFDEGQALSEHTAPFDALVNILEGSADVTISGVSRRLQAGQMIVMPANAPHAVKATGPFKMMLIMIKSQNR